MAYRNMSLYDRERKMRFFKVWLSTFMFIVAVITLVVVSISCAKQGQHLLHMLPMLLGKFH